MGRIAEAKVAAVLVSQGLEVYLPVFGNGTCDLIAIGEGRTTKVETKYVTGRRGAYEVSLRQVRANRAEMLSKLFNSANSDVLAVYVAPLDRVAFLPSAPLHGRTTISLRESMLDEYALFAGAQDAELPVPFGRNQWTDARHRDGLPVRRPHVGVQRAKGIA